MIGKLWLRSDEKLLKCAADPLRREREIRQLSEARNVGLTAAMLTLLGLFGFMIFGLITQNLFNTEIVSVFGLFVFQLLMVCHVDTKIKMLKLVGHLVEQGVSEQPKVGNPQELSNKTDMANS